MPIRRMRPGEEVEVSQLVGRGFDRYVAPDFPPEGVAEFRRYAAPDALAERAKGSSAVLVAEEDGRITGVLELRWPDRIALFFVEAPGRGLGRRLFDEALTLCRNKCPGPGVLTVHSSRHAVPVYRHFGFEPAGDERSEAGITYLPMEYRFERAGGASEA